MKTSVIEVHNMVSVPSVDEVERRLGELPGDYWCVCCRTDPVLVAAKLRVGTGTKLSTPFS